MNIRFKSVFAETLWFIVAISIMTGEAVWLVSSSKIGSSLVGSAALHKPEYYWSRSVVPKPSADLKKGIEVKAVYFVPKDKVSEVVPEWSLNAGQVLDEMQAFHNLQFGGKMNFQYGILPETIVGENNSVFYNGTDTGGGNPHAWSAVREELNRRLGEVSSTATFSVRLVIYEGVGAMGGNDTVLVSSGYLRSKTYRPLAASIFYHELGHVMGLRDDYDYTTGSPRSDDIMGWGRIRPLGQTYISDANKKRILSN
jgi:hypothetical protein